MGTLRCPNFMAGLLVSACGALALPGTASAAIPGSVRPLCDDNGPLCTEINEFPNGKTTNYEGLYVGHDEPSLLFYSNVPGSGNHMRYRLVLPRDPPVLPNQAGTGGTFNFQLHPAFWFGLAVCDTQSYPNPNNGVACTPDSDANIFDGSDPTKADFIGKHPGTAFMEMQFYPPGWVLWPPGNSCDPMRWCAALNIDSISEDPNHGTLNNAACLGSVGIEPVNFAFITHNGLSHPGGPPNPVNSTLVTFTPDPKLDLFMNSGDVLIVDLHDTPHGLEIVIHDLTSGESGSMTASAANGFGQVKYDPAGTTCNNLPYDFHPMYSTSSEHTRVPWAAHSYNVAFADEIGHFEYCNLSNGPGGQCIQAGANDPAGLDADDVGCFNAMESSYVAIGGCLGTDTDFDGVPYQLVWPGTFSSAPHDRQLHPRSILFSSPTFVPTNEPERRANYDRVAFEADMPRIEVSSLSPNNNCNRTTGAGCVNPPKGASFYPIFSTRNSDDTERCMWQLGGANIPGTSNTFGGTSTAEYGPLLLSLYQKFGSSTVPVFRYNNFRQVLNNPCRSGEEEYD
ncbi:MAG: hypothetical protein NVS9B2_22720 [Steroidobacteraceae bacterium]